MEVTTKVKEVAIDISSRVSQIVFGALVISLFVTQNTSPPLILTGIISFLLCLFVALVIASTMKEET